MLNLPKECVIFDTEFTSWEGAMERNWGGENEYQEIVQIGAILVDTEAFKEKENLLLYIKPIKNPLLSDYFINLTGITQTKLDEKGLSLKEALTKFTNFIGGREVYSFGGDENVIEENCKLIDLPFPLDRKKFHNICDTFEEFGVKTEGYMSSTIVNAFDEEAKNVGHNGLNDARTILEGLKLLAKKHLS